jgi:hypothetical protein
MPCRHRHWFQLPPQTQGEPQQNAAHGANTSHLFALKKISKTRATSNKHTEYHEGSACVCIPDLESSGVKKAIERCLPTLLTIVSPSFVISRHLLCFFFCAKFKNGILVLHNEKIQTFKLQNQCDVTMMVIPCLSWTTRGGQQLKDLSAYETCSN